MSMILMGYCALYTQEMRFASLKESSKAETFSLLLISLTIQMMHLTISKLQTKSPSSKFSLLSVIGIGVLSIFS